MIYNAKKWLSLAAGFGWIAAALVFGWRLFAYLGESFPDSFAGWFLAYIFAWVFAIFAGSALIDRILILLLGPGEQRTVARTEATSTPSGVAAGWVSSLGTAAALTIASLGVTTADMTDHYADTETMTHESTKFTSTL